MIINESESVKVNHKVSLRKIRSALFDSYRHSENTCASQKENQLNIDEHWALVQKRKMAVLLIKERAFGVRKTGSVFLFLPQGEDIFIYLFK